jgi:predicted Zn-dependent peptidase
MSASKWVVAIAGMALAVCGFAQQVKVEKYKLPNGMTVILHEDHSLPIATINTWFYVGSKDEPDRRSGFAHLFEHLMFMGTKRVPNGQFDTIMETAGGHNNASTTEDRTNYYSAGPSNLLPTLLWLDAERLESLADDKTQEKVDIQRSVVENERKQNTENTPYGKGYEAINGLMFPVGHPYHTSVIGSYEDLAAASVEDVKNFFRTFYIPNNASLVVAGDFDPKVIKPLISKLFGTLPRRNDVVRRSVPPVNFRGVHLATMVDQVQFPKTIMVYHSPAAYKPGDVEMKLASNVLSDGLGTRLYDRLIVDSELATDVSVFQESRYLGSLFYIDATAADGVPIEKVERAIDEEVAKFRRDGPTASELTRLKAKAEFNLLSGLESLDQKADMLNEYQFYLGQPDSFRTELDRYRAATPESVRAVSSKVLDPNNRLILRVIPAAPESQVNPRDTKPTLAPEATFSPPLPSQFTLSNGIKVFYWSRPQLPLIAIATLFGVGADRDPANLAGRTAMTAEMLSNGAGNLSAEAFQQSLDNLGASFGSSAGRQGVTTSLSTISSNFTPALKLYADALMRPKFDAQEWARVQRTTMGDLQASLDNPNTIMRLVANEQYFGAGHPYAQAISGTPTTIRALTLAGLKSTYHQIFQPQNATIFVAGSLSQAEVKGQLESEFGSWKNTAPKPAALTYPVVPDTNFRVIVVDRPGAVQTNIRFILPSVPYGDPKRIPLKSLAVILGGTFTSRLNHNLREEKGYTYGAGASYSFDPQLGFFTAAASVRADVTGPSVEEFLKEMRGIKSGNVTEAETQKARSTERSEVVESLSSLPSLLDTAISLYEQGRPFSGLSEDMTAVSRMNAGSLNQIAGGAIELDKGVLVLVGDKATILKQIHGLRLPQPIIVDPPK